MRFTVGKECLEGRGGRRRCSGGGVGGGRWRWGRQRRRRQGGFSIWEQGGVLIPFWYGRRGPFVKPVGCAPVVFDSGARGQRERLFCHSVLHVKHGKEAIGC